MKAYMYEVSVVEGALAMTHGWSERIREIWVPEFNIIFNEKYGAFRSETPRNKVYPEGTFNLVAAQQEESPMEEIELGVDDVRSISTHVQAAEHAKETIKKVLNLKEDDEDEDDPDVQQVKKVLNDSTESN
jgi:hypothetical protein